MNINKLVKMVIAGVFYAGGIFFAIFVARSILMGKGMLSLEGVIKCTIIVIMPSLIATIILMSTLDKRDKRFIPMKMFVVVVFVWYCFLLADLLFFYRLHFRYICTFNLSTYIKTNANFIPFKTIMNYLTSFFKGYSSKSVILINIVGNIVAFTPMGVLLPCLFKKLQRLRPFIIVMLAILFSVEVIQLLTFAGSFDIDDVILNIIGAAFMYWIWKLEAIQRWLKKIYVL